MKKIKKKKIPKYKSGFEKTFGDLLEELGISFDYETKKIKYVKEHVYSIDFVTESGILIETKGYFKAVDRQKMIDVKKQNPELDIRLVFMNDGKLHKLSNTRYSDWCEKHGFPFIISKTGELPKEWIKELKKVKK